MKPNSKFILAGIIGVSLTTQANDLGINLIKKETLEKLEAERQFPSMTQSLLDSRIIQETKVKGYYFLNITRLSEEKELSKNENQQEIVAILNDILRSKVKISFKKFKDMNASSQDYMPRAREVLEQGGRFKRGP